MYVTIANPTSITELFAQAFFQSPFTVFNSRLITQAYLLLLGKGGGSLERDFSSARAFEMYG